MMTRWIAPLLIVPLLIAVACCQTAAADPAPTQAKAHQTHRAHHARHVRKADLATAAAKPASLPAAIAGTEPAPVPNEAVNDVPPGQAPETRVTPSMLQLHYPSVGDGYVQGSSPQAMDDRNAAKAPGVEVQVPLKQ
jgi:hypothetical protein